MEIRLKLKIKDGVEIELSPQESKDLYELLKKMHDESSDSIYPIIIERWIKEYPWYNTPPIFYTSGSTTGDVQPINICYSLNEG